MKKISIIIISCFLYIILFIISDQQCKAEEKLPAETPYKIGCGDILTVTTWKEPELSREDILVKIDGTIAFPLLNDVQADGLTTLQLKNKIEKGLTNFVDSPAVTVSIINPASQKFYILGEIIRTGEYPIYKKLTVLQAFAIAGGFTEWASKKEIILLRDIDGIKKIITINYKDFIKGKNLDRNIIIKADDTIVIP